MENKMDRRQAIEVRHSVRQYTERPIPQETASELQHFVEECNAKSGLHMQLILGDSKGFSGMLRGVILKNAQNYLAIIGKDDSSLEELGGYWGEQVVLKATQLGLASCWFAMGVKKGLLEIAPGEKYLIVVALGYAGKDGTPHSSKPLERLYSVADGSAAPGWFMEGVKAAQLAPTAKNQQKFRLALLEDGSVCAESLGGSFSGIDLGIVKCHFEIGVGAHSFEWVATGDR
jgi:nitroreductase